MGHLGNPKLEPHPIILGYHPKYIQTNDGFPYLIKKATSFKI